MRKIYHRISQQARFGGELRERVYRSRIHDVDQLKSRLIEEWGHFQVTHQVRSHLSRSYDEENATIGEIRR